MAEWRIPLADLEYGVEEEAAVSRVLRSKWLSMGPEVQAFERAFAEFVGVKHAIAVANGTAALHLSYLALGLGPGDEIVQPAINFVAAANMTVAAGATPIFADIVGLDEPTIDPPEIERRITPHTKTVVVMHYGGYLCRMAEIRAICQGHGLALIEDACHAVGACYLDPQQSPLGKRAGTLGDIACFSFFSNKNLATGEGGMVVTNRDDLAERLRLLRSHGMTTLTWDRHKGHASSYDVVLHGYNYRLDELRAALGRTQLEKLEHNNRLRAQLVSAYRHHLAVLPGWIVPFADYPGDSAYHLMVAVAPDERTRSQVVRTLTETGIQTSLHYPCLPDFEAFEQFRANDVERSCSFARRAITLPLFPRMTVSQVEEICSLIRNGAVITEVGGKRRNHTDGDNTIRRVVFIGGLEDGRMAAEVLMKHPGVNLVGLFVLDDEAGKNVSGFRTFDDLAKPPILRKIKRLKRHVADVNELNPDIIFVVGFSQIIPKDILGIPPLGVIGFHTAILPGRRGCSPVIWAIIDGLCETGVTMFYMDEGIDTGDVIATKSFRIEPDDYATDVLKKADEATIQLLTENLDSVLAATASRIKQDEALCTYTRKRTPADGEIDWSKPAQEIVRMIRALAPPYPGAHTFGGDGVPILIEKARVATNLVLPPPRFLLRDPFRQTVLCVVAHPDDEVLGVGGTLALHAHAGGDVIVLILTEGEQEKFADTPHCSTRRESALKAAKVMGTKEVILQDFPDQRLETVPFIEIIKCIEAAITTFRPTVVYTHHRGDANTDHQIVFKATYAACRPMSNVGASIQRLVLFETPSSTDQAPQVGEYVFTPNCFVDVEPVWEKKIAALKCYPSEMIGDKHPRRYDYIEALARMRGGYAGYGLAEAFVLVRERQARPALDHRE